MTGLLYLEDQYLKEFQAEITSVIEPKKIILSATAFYPTGGGQPSDTGYLIRLSDSRRFEVTSVRKESGEVVHEVGDEGLVIGDMVKGTIDWEKRYMLMRMHTTAHVLSSIIHLRTGALITGNQLGTDQSRIDFDLEEFDKGDMDRYIKEANALVRQGGAITASYIGRKEAEGDPTLSKLAKGLPQGIEELRIVTIADIDRQADGGTHVHDLKEIGTIVFLEAKNKGKNNRRVYFTLQQ